MYSSAESHLQPPHRRRDLRNALMVYEWEMGAKGHAARSGVAQFENWCALNAAEEVDYIQIQKLYE